MSGFKVLLTHSGEGFESSASGAPPPGYNLPNFTTLLQSGGDIRAARSDRTAIVSSDLNYHSVVRASGQNIAAGCDSMARHRIATSSTVPAANSPI